MLQRCGSRSPQPLGQPLRILIRPQMVQMCLLGPDAAAALWSHVCWCSEPRRAISTGTLSRPKTLYVRTRSIVRTHCELRDLTRDRLGALVFVDDGLAEATFNERLFAGL